jgi:hypothetical protein
MESGTILGAAVEAMQAAAGSLVAWVRNTSPSRKRLLKVGGKRSSLRQRRAADRKKSKKRQADTWQPRKPTLHVIGLMRLGLSINIIAERKDVKVSRDVRNLRKIRSRAVIAGRLPRP